jgi:4-amino-4-deoxy-L-arabinose transferase-like glycosyltransferase
MPEISAFFMGRDANCAPSEGRARKPIHGNFRVASTVDGDLHCPPMPVHRGNKSTAWAWLAAVLAVAAVLRTVPAPQWELGDAENYSAVAWRMSQGGTVVGTYAGPPHKPGEGMGPRAFAIRPGVTFPASLAFRVLPPGAWAAAAWPLLLGLSEVVLAFLLGRRLAGDAVGLIAALMIATMPQSVVAGRTLMADMPAAVLAGWAVLAFLAGAAATRGAGSMAFGAAAGALLGCSWLAKETVVLMAPAFAVVALVAPDATTKARWRTAAAAIAVFLAVVACESWVYARITGDWMFRAHELARNFEQCRENFWYQASRSTQASSLGIGGGLLDRLAVVGPSAILLCRPSLGIGVVSIGAAAFARWRGHRTMTVALAWLAMLALAFNFGSTSPSAYRPIPPFSTYLYALILPGCLVVAGMLGRELESARALPGSGRRAIAPLACIVALAAAYAAASVALVQRNARASEDLREAARVIPSCARVATDCSSRLTLSLYLTGRPDIAPSVGAFDDPSSVASAEYVVLAPERVHSLHDRYGYELPGAVRQLDDWDELLHTPTVTVFVRRADTSGRIASSE